MGVTREMCWETGKANICGMVTAPPPCPNRRRRGSRKISAVQASSIVQPAQRTAPGWGGEWGSGAGAESTSKVRREVLSENTFRALVFTLQSSATRIHFLVQTL